MAEKLGPRTERLGTMHAAYFCSLTAAPEEDATKQLTEWATKNGLTNEKQTRLFGRNTYPTDKPEPHGYELYLTLTKGQLKACKNAENAEISGGLYATLRFKNIENLPAAWKQLWGWVEKSGYEPVGVQKGRRGWVAGGFEEQVNWQDQKPPTEWVFDLWVQLKEETTKKGK